MKGEIYRLCKDIESCEQAANNTKSELLSQSRNLEIEFQQTIETMKKQAEENIKKLSSEKVHNTKYLFLNNICTVHIIGNFVFIFRICRNLLK